MNFLKKLLVATATVLGLALPSLANGTNYYVAPNGSSGNNGLSPGAPKTITWCLDNATNGDNIYMADGTYPSSQANQGGQFEHLHGGTPGARVTYIGNIANPGNVRLGTTFKFTHNVYGALHGNSYVTLKGVSVNGSIELAGYTGGTPQQALGDTIVYCIADSGFTAGRFDSCYIAHNRFGHLTGGRAVTFHIGDGSNLHSFYNKIVDNDIYTSISSTDGGNAINVIRLDSCQVLSNNVIQRHWPSANNTIHPNSWFGVQRTLVLDNKWTLRNDLDPSGQMYALNIRDSCRFNYFARDTFLLDTLSTGASKIEFATSGTYGASGYNTYSHCLFKPKGVIGYQSTGDGDLHEYNEYVISGGPFGFPSGNVVMDSITINHCTFFTDATTLLTSVDTTTYAKTTNTITNNIFYSLGGAGTLMAYKWSVAAGTRAYNLYYRTTASDSAARFDYAYSSADGTSKWANPGFTTARWNTPVLRPAPSSLAFSSNLWPDQYVGAFSAAAASAPTITTTSLATARECAAYSQAIAVSGGTPPYTFTVPLDQGFSYYNYSIDPATGVITNPSPCCDATIDFVIQVEDAVHDTVSKAYQMNSGIDCVEMSTAASLPSGTATTPYSTTVEAIHGTEPYTFSIGWAGNFNSGGYDLSSDGEITHSSPDEGDVYFSVKVTDALGDTASRVYAITIGPSPTSLGIQNVVASAMSDNSATITFYTTLDTDSSAVFTLLYGSGAAADTAVTPVRLAGTRSYVCRLFGLTPGTEYNYTLSGTRLGQTFTNSGTVTTKAASWWRVGVKGPLVYVDPSKSDANSGLTPTLAKATVAAAWTALLAQPNHGKGGGICLVPGTVYYGNGTFEDTGNYASADSMYHIISDGTAWWSGSDPRLVSGSLSLTWAAYGANGAYYTVYAANDSIGSVWFTASGAISRCLAAASRLEALNGANPLSSTTPRWWAGGGDTLVVYTTGVSPATQSVRTGYYGNLCYLQTPYVRVHGINFTMAGGTGGIGSAVRGGAYATAATRVAGMVVDSCTFQWNAETAIVSVNGTTNGDGGFNDSCVVAGNKLYDDIWKFSYAQCKGRLEEYTGIESDGSYWVVRDNVIKGFFNGIGFLSNGSTDTTRGAFNEIYNDTVKYVRDDGIELDNCVNTGSVVSKCTVVWMGSGLSLAPNRRGPLWVLYNVFLRPVATGAFKVGNGGVGEAYFYHNTAYTPSGATTAGFYNAAIGAFQRQHFRNNILIGAASSYEPVTNQNTAAADTANNSTSTFNYNNLFVWSGTTVYRWKGVAYDSTTIKTGRRTEMNGVFSNPLFRDTTCWKDTTTTTQGPQYAFIPRGRAVGSGQRIAGVNDRDQFISVRLGTPDMGALEYYLIVSTSRRQWFWRFLHVLL